MITNPTVGQRYRLHLPDYPSRHPLKGLLDRVCRFDHMGDYVDGKDPARLLGISTVTVLGTGYTIDPEPERHVFFGFDFDRLYDETDERPEQKPKPTLKRPVPGVLVHLARWTTPVIRVEVSSAEAAQLGLDPDRRYYVRGVVTPYDWDSDDYDWDEEHDAKVVEEHDFVIPARWLADLDTTGPWDAYQLEQEVSTALQPLFYKL
jgi:hypothetical protein